MSDSIQKQRGFTLLEAIVALGILAIAILGSFAGVVYASRDLREGQLRQYKMILVDATAQRSLLGDKSSWSLLAVAPGTPPNALPIGAAPWTVDPSPISGGDGVDAGIGDVGTGAYFTILPNGTMTRVTPKSPVPCDDPSLPDGTFCRELMLTTGLPSVDGGIPIPGSQQVTQWIRVSRKGDPPAMAVLNTRLMAR